jgi:uncharacterized membrane protein YkvA (DUF1232 family)
MSAKTKASSDQADFDPRRPIDPTRALVPAVVRVNEQRVARGFWPKMRKVAAKIPFASDALSVWFCARDPATPATAKGIMLAGLAYFVMPVDAIPDVLTVVGFTDDAAVFAAMLSVVGRHLRPQHKADAKAFLARLRED